MYERILVPTDGSRVAEAATRQAIELAGRFDAVIHAIYVVEPERLSYIAADTRGELTRRGREALEAVEELVNRQGLESTTAVIDDGNSVYESVLGYGEEHDIDLLVMGTHGKGGIGRMVLGSIAEQTLRESPIPVMTVHESTDVNASFDSILVPFDGSESAMTAVDHASDLAVATDGTVDLLNVVNYSAITSGEVDAGMVLDPLEEAGERALETAAERVEEKGATVGDKSVQIGSPFRAILEQAELLNADCIVMGTHGRSGINRLLLGSVAERVVRQSDLPVIATKASHPE